MLDITLKETRVYQEIKEEGREEEAIALVTSLLTRKLRQELSQEMHTRLLTLSLPELEDLSEALLDFTSLDDLQTWLQARINRLLAEVGERARGKGERVM